MNKQTMEARNAISGSLAECYITIDGRRLRLATAKNLEAKMEKTKTKVGILGKTGKGNKPTGVEYSGKMTIYYNQSILRQALYKYKETGEDLYYDIQVTNEDPTSSVGRQTIILLGVNNNGGILTKFDVDAETLEEDVDFTFEDWQMPESFKELPELG